MPIHTILTSTSTRLRGEGPHSQIVVSSRVRLARNLRGFAFPGWHKTRSGSYFESSPSPLTPPR